MKRWLLAAGVLAMVTAVWAADSAVKTGTFKVGTAGMIVTVKVPKADAKKPLEVPIPFGKDAFLPPGKYEAAVVQLYKQDKQGKAWCLNAISDLGKLKTFDVAEGQTVTAEGGEGLKIRTRVVVTSETPKKVKGLDPPGPPLAPVRTVTVYLDYVGQSGEHYGPKVMMGTAPPPARPIVRIKDENDRVLSEGQYHYGAKGFGGFG
jgi:hypothetical protein